MKNVNDLKKIAINSAFAVEEAETKAKKFNNDEEMKNEFFVSGEKLAKKIFADEVLVETNYNKNELKDFIKNNGDFFKFDEEKIENLSYKDMVKMVNNSTENIIDFRNDVKPLFERTFAEYGEEDTLNECKQDYFESLGRKKLLPILLKEIEKNVEHFKNVKGFMINDVDNEFGREDD